MIKNKSRKITILSSKTTNKQEYIYFIAKTYYKKVQKTDSFTNKKVLNQMLNNINEMYNTIAKQEFIQEPEFTINDNLEKMLDEIEEFSEL